MCGEDHSERGDTEDDGDLTDHIDGSRGLPLLVSGHRAEGGGSQRGEEQRAAGPH